MKVTLETERLELRPVSEDDAGEVYEGWTSDPGVTKYVTWNTHESIEDTKAFLRFCVEEYKKPEKLCFGIVKKDEHRLIGMIDVVGIVKREDGKSVPVIGYVLSRKYWNRGFMTEACRCVTDFLFSKGYPEVFIDAVRENTGSNRVIQKCGGVYLRTDEDLFPKKGCSFFVNRYSIKNPKIG